MASIFSTWKKNPKEKSELAYFFITSRNFVLISGLLSLRLLCGLLFWFFLSDYSAKFWSFWNVVIFTTRKSNCRIAKGPISVFLIVILKSLRFVAQFFSTHTYFPLNISDQPAIAIFIRSDNLSWAKQFSFNWSNSWPGDGVGKFDWFAGVSFISLFSIKLKFVLLTIDFHVTLSLLASSQQFVLHFAFFGTIRLIQISMMVWYQFSFKRSQLPCEDWKVFKILKPNKIVWHHARSS